jgi:segregation and condensation protein B
MSDAQDEAEHDAPGRPRDPDDGEDVVDVDSTDVPAADDPPDSEAEHAQPAGEDGSLAAGQTDLEELDDDADIGGPQGPGLAGTVALALGDLKGALEALILVSDKPVPAMRLARLTRQDLGHVRRALGELAEDYRGRGIALDEIAGGYQFRTSPRYAPFVRSLTQQKPVKLTRAQLEVLAIIAYRQPVTRPEIDEVRGVDSGSAIKVLLERDVIKIIGKRDDAGRPMLYGTTNDFLELFGLKSLRDLPTLKEFAELTPESRDIYERRIGEPLPGQGQGMDLKTHYEAPPDEPESEDEANAAAEGAESADGDAASASGPAGDEEVIEAPEVDSAVGDEGDGSVTDVVDAEEGEGERNHRDGELGG